jgi:photosystem II stability/assembly factor-like uncharacterized protein
MPCLAASLVGVMCGRIAVVVLVVGLLAVAGSASGEREAGDPCWGRLVSAGFGYAVCGGRVFVVDEDWRAWRRVVTPRQLGAGSPDVVMVDARHGWMLRWDCAAAVGTLYRTADSGRSWRRSNVESTNCSAGSHVDLFFRDTRHGWLTSIEANGSPPAHLSKTLDGGKTWRPAGEGLPILGSAVLRTPNEGWAARSMFAVPQQLYVTRDGARSWYRRVLPPPSGWSGAQVFPDVPTFFGVRGVLPVNLVRNGRVALAFYTTADAGRSWRLRAVRPVSYPVHARNSTFARYVPTSIASPSAWWILGGPLHRALQVTGDGGQHWRVVQTRQLPASHEATLTAADANRAWISTSGLFGTEDGGQTWRQLNPK